MARPMLSKLLASEKPPFFLAIFFAALAWSITRYADSLAATPAIEYEVIHSQGSIDVRLDNLSDNKTFTNLIFVLRTPGYPHALSKPMIEAKQPAWEGEDKPNVDGETAKFYITKFHPHWVFILHSNITTGTKSVLQLRRCDQSIHLLPPSIETYIIRHQNPLLLAILISWAVLTTVMLIKGVGDEDLSTPISPNDASASDSTASNNKPRGRKSGKHTNYSQRRS